MQAFVTGAMGFVGRHLVERLERDGHEITVYDRKDQPEGWTTTYVVGDVLDRESLCRSLRAAKPDVVFHLAALADVRSALTMPFQQLEQNLVATLNVLEAMRCAGIPSLMFTSTAVVYGDTDALTITERGNAFPQQTSVYGAMKLACESLINAYCLGYGFRADILRLVSVVGAGYRHGNLIDFYHRLQADPTMLQLLGSPTQQKYFIDVHDVVEAINVVTNRDHVGADVWNVSHDEPNTIHDSIQAVCRGLKIPIPEIRGGESWPGDLPQLVLDCSKLRALGWAPQVPIVEGMDATVADFIERDV